MAREAKVTVVLHARVMSGDGADGTVSAIADAVGEYIDGAEVFVGDRGYVVDFIGVSAQAVRPGQAVTS